MGENDATKPTQQADNLNRLPNQAAQKTRVEREFHALAIYRRYLSRQTLVTAALLRFFPLPPPAT